MMVILVYLGNKKNVVSIVLGIYMIAATTNSTLSIINTLLIMIFSMAFQKCPLAAIPSYSITIDTIACTMYQLDWAATITSGLLWNAKWIAISGVIEIAYRAYRRRRAQLPKFTTNENLCMA